MQDKHEEMGVTDDDDIKCHWCVLPDYMPHLLGCPALEEQCCQEDQGWISQRVRTSLISS